ncbi:Methyltransferase domain-containing protein [Saccharopolyspora kobensis]|uniref:Methyltransferase domain-containing protein n=1 Tax=Saccharopolyspora kobensis TaxID=146035 RepID=A0A1H6C596_9PSEU|nr:class I SAM-dependent methyltransferase [Saccharopolyspora kobensis]SEG68098.1 Methyltransferase domain-containing protein [Saccharopolyspora kobensis]SFC28673.1 Methyltransferase domain-containing protein [Saccharopolyspora kobensis]
MSAADHYDRLLAEHYTWMLGGDIRAAASAQAELLRELGVRAGADDTIAVDLGCGPGPQSLALAELGFSPVIAVDTSAKLLDELEAHAAELAPEKRIEPVRGDICAVFPDLVEPGTAAAIVCMGDTLTHLPTTADVSALIGHVAGALRPGGHFVATFRDLTGELGGTDRFLPVRSEADKILTCFLDYVDDNTVLVHDLLHVRSGNGWALEVSSYPKLRLPPAWLTEQCRAAGLQVWRETTGPRGLCTLHVVKR